MEKKACNLKIMLIVFSGWRPQTLTQTSGWTIGGTVFQWCQFFCFWHVLLLCRLWPRKLGELVSEMQGNFSYSMKTLHKLYGLGFYEEIGKTISRKQGDEVMKKIFDAGWWSEGMIFGDGEKLSC